MNSPVSWKTKLIAAVVALLLAFALGAEVGSNAVYDAMKDEGLNCETDDDIVWS